MKKVNANPSKSKAKDKTSLDQEVLRIKEYYLQKFGSQFQLPHSLDIQDDKDSAQEKIEQIKSRYGSKIPPNCAS